MKQNEYMPRLVDALIERYLKIFGAIAIEGPKWCGKTETGKHFAKSNINLANPNNNYANKMMAKLNSLSIFDGDKPKLIDEWQEAPSIWNAIKEFVSESKLKGQLILTGSSTPNDNEQKHLHSGAGRIGRIQMRPFTLFESEISTGSIKMSALFNNDSIKTASGKLDLKSLIEIIIKGGWPALNTRDNILTLKDVMTINREYINNISYFDINTVDGIKKDPIKIKLVLRSLARNISTLVKSSTIFRDVQINDKDEVSKITILNYISLLKRLYIVEDVPGWSPEIRSKIRMQTSPKRIFVDPSLAVATLEMDAEWLTKDLKTLGFLFENLVIRDLLSIARINEWHVYHYRDNSDLEIDVIIEKSYQQWAALEIKLGTIELEKTCKKMILFKNKIIRNGGTKPQFLAIVVGVGATYHKTKEGIHIIPIDCLN